MTKKEKKNRISNLSVKDKGDRKMKMKDLFPEYFKYLELNNKKQSVYKIKKRLEKVSNYFYDQRINSITKKDILNFKISLEDENYSYSYKKALYYALNEFFEYLVLYDYIDDNIVKKVGNFKNKEPNKKYNYWTYEEYKRFIDNCEEQIYKSLYSFLFFTGCRLGESLALTFNDIENNTIKIDKTITKEFYNGKRIITTPKTKKSNREIHIDNYLIKELYNLMQIYKNKYSYFDNDFYIFGGIKPLAPTTVERKKNLICEKISLKKIKLHEFRHSHATLLLQNNIPIKDVAERLGHSDITLTLNIYTHVSKDKEKRTLQILNSIRSN